MGIIPGVGGFGIFAPPTECRSTSQTRSQVCSALAAALLPSLLHPPPSLLTQNCGTADIPKSNRVSQLRSPGKGACKARDCDKGSRMTLPAICGHRPPVKGKCGASEARGISLSVDWSKVQSALRVVAFAQCMLTFFWLLMGVGRFIQAILHVC